MDTEWITIENHCFFHLGDEPDAWQSWYDDSTWQEVHLPHDWSVTLPFDRNCSSGTGYLPGGIGWYRLHIAPKKEWMGKRIRIVFDGIYKNSRVWCNSTYLGERPNGYICFGYDITDVFHFDTDNIVSVYVNHQEIADSRWYTGSGITRKVSLCIEEKIHPVANGIFFATPSANQECAQCEINAELINTTVQDALVTVTTLLFAPDGALALKEQAQVFLPVGTPQTVSLKGIVHSPSLWSPDAPWLYTLKTYLSYQDGETAVHTLADEKKVGIRSFTFDADHGFFLNDTALKLKGVCVHEDAGCFGNAVPTVVWAARLGNFKKMGCNAIRMSHNPHMPELYDLCDAMGFLVMDEAFDEWEGPKNKWSTGHNVYPPKHQGYYVNFPEWHERDLIDLIRRDRNHPSIILWSTGNEIDYPNDPYCHPSFSTMTGNNDANKPEAERVYNPSRPNAERLAPIASHLSEIVHQTDATRPVTLAAAFPELSAKLGFIDSLDVVGFNYKEHLYEEHHIAYPDKPFLGSENGHSIANWLAVTENDYISGQFLWTGIDYLGEAHGWPIHGSSAGLLTLAGLEKTAYYRRQSLWSSIPMIHLATIASSQSTKTSWGEISPNALSCEFAPVSECWDYPLGEEVVVKCYTNLYAVELFLNEESLGIYEKEVHADCILAKVTYAPGKLCAKGIDTYKNISNTLYSTGCACQMSSLLYDIQKDAPSQNSEWIAALSAERQISQILITLKDREGHRVYNASSMLHVQMQCGTLLGLENGDLSDVTEYGVPYRRAYRGQLVIYAQADAAGKLSFSVSGETLKTLQIG